MNINQRTDMFGQYLSWNALNDCEDREFRTNLPKSLITLNFFWILELLEKKVCSHLFWSPNGQYIVLAECREVGALEFIDTNDFSTMASGEHYKATTVEWDPTGRFVASSVSAWNHKVCYNIIVRKFGACVVRYIISLWNL